MARLKKEDTTDRTLFVRTTEDRLETWDRKRITERLVVETGMPLDKADKVSKEAEDFIRKSGIKFISAPLVRELVNAKLIEKGYEEYRKRHTRLGMPLHDMTELFFISNKENSNVHHNSEAINLTIAGGAKKEYALLNVFSEDVASAHQQGVIHLHDLDYIDRPYCSGNSLEYLKKFGLVMDGRGNYAVAYPAKHIHVLILHLTKFAAALQGQFAGAIGWDAVNLFLAPFLVGKSYKDIKQTAQMMIYEFSQQAVSRGGQVTFTDTNYYWEVPKHFADVPAVGPGGKLTGNNYEDYEEEAQQFARAAFEVYMDGDAYHRPFFFPKPDLHITEKFFKTKDHEDFLRGTAETAAKMGNTYYIFDRGDEAKISECFTPSTPFCFTVNEKVVYSDAEKAFDGIRKRKLDSEWYEPEDKVGIPTLDLKSGNPKITRVARLLRRRHSGDVLKITLRDGSSIEVTENHPLRVLSRGGLGLVRAKHVREGDLLPVSRSTPLIENVEAIDLVKESVSRGKELFVYGYSRDEVRSVFSRRGVRYSDYRHHLEKGRLPAWLVLEEGVEYSDKTIGLKNENLPSLPPIIQLDVPFGRFAGLFLAEGTLEKTGEMVFSLSKKEEELASFIRDFISSILNRNPREYRDKRWNSMRIIFSSITFRWLVEELLGLGSCKSSKQKGLGSVFFASPLEFRQAVVSGFLEGDGYVRERKNRSEVSFHIASEKLAADLRNLLKTLRISTTLRHHLNPNPRNREELLPSYTVMLSSSDTNLLDDSYAGGESQVWDAFPFREAGFALEETRLTPSRYSRQGAVMLSMANKLLLRENGWLSLVRKGDLIFLRVSSIERKKFDGYVYDFEVEDDGHILQLPNSIYSSNCCRLQFKLNEEDLNDAKRPWKMRYSAIQNVTINLPRAAYFAQGDDDKLFEFISRSMDVAAKAHIQKRAFIKKILDQGAASSLPVLTMELDGEPYYRFGRATFLMGMLGLNEAVQYHTGEQMHETNKAFLFGLKMIAFMKKRCEELGKEHGMSFVLEQTPAESTAYRMARLDMEQFQEQTASVVRGEANTPYIYYTNSTYLNVGAPISPMERVTKEGVFHPLIDAGAMSHVWLADANPNPEALSSFVKKTFKNTQNTQIAFSPEFTFCKTCNKTFRGLKDECPDCGSARVRGITQMSDHYKTVPAWSRGGFKALVAKAKTGGYFS